VSPDRRRSKDKLLPRAAYLRRQGRFGLLALAMVAASLGIGVVGYHVTEGLGWLDSLLNASMLLGGMGPVESPATTAGKHFASFYALFSGIVFLMAAGVFAAPLLHRLLHRFHLEGSGRP
jgi:hypothetical protein